VNLRRALVGVVTALTLAGCSSVVTGHGSAGVRPTPPAETGGFPSTSSAPDTSTPPASRPGALESPDGDFSVVLPAGWSDGADRLSGIALTGYLGPTANGFETNVNVVRESVGGLNLAQYYRATIANVQSTLQVHGLTRPTYHAVGGEPGLDYSFTDQQAGRTLEQRQTLSVHDGNGYVITYTALPSAYAASIDDANAIIASWQWG
jgi:hypothetical protein